MVRCQSVQFWPQRVYRGKTFSVSNTVYSVVSGHINAGQLIAGQLNADS